MSSPTDTKARLETAKTADHTAVTASFTALGTPMGFPSLGWFVTSTFDESVWISTDGTNNKLLIAGDGTSFLIPFGSLKPGDRSLAIPKGTQLYIKQGPDGAPSSGDISITPIYGDQ